jgi:myosin heavy subunit
MPINDFFYLINLLADDYKEKRELFDNLNTEYETLLGKNKELIETNNLFRKIFGSPAKSAASGLSFERATPDENVIVFLIKKYVALKNNLSLINEKIADIKNENSILDTENKVFIAGLQQVPANVATINKVKASNPPNLNKAVAMELNKIPVAIPQTIKNQTNQKLQQADTGKKIPAIDITFKVSKTELEKVMQEAPKVKVPTTAISQAPVIIQPPTKEEEERDKLERIAKEKFEKEEAERKVKQAEQERLAKEQAQKQRLVREQAEKERLAREQAEKERLAKQTEQERLAREQAEKERLAKQTEQERLAREQAEVERKKQETDAIKKKEIDAKSELTKLCNESNNKVNEVKSKANLIELKLSNDEKVNEDEATTLLTDLITILERSESEMKRLLQSANIKQEDVKNEINACKEASSNYQKMKPELENLIGKIRQKKSEEEKAKAAAKATAPVPIPVQIPVIAPISTPVIAPISTPVTIPAVHNIRPAPGSDEDTAFGILKDIFAIALDPTADKNELRDLFIEQINKEKNDTILYFALKDSGAQADIINLLKGTTVENRIKNITSQTGGSLTTDPYYLKYMKYRTKYLIKSGKTDEMIRKIFKL